MLYFVASAAAPSSETEGNRIQIDVQENVSPELQNEQKKTKNTHPMLQTSSLRSSFKNKTEKFRKGRSRITIGTQVSKQCLQPANIMSELLPTETFRNNMY